MNSRKLKAIRVENGYTQEILAKKVGISAKTYNRKELGVIDFTSREIIRISMELKLSLDAINEVFFDNYIA